MPAALPYRLGDGSPPINATSAGTPSSSSAAAAATNINSNNTTPPSSAIQQPQTPNSNPLHPHPYHHPHHHPHQHHHPHPYQLQHHHAHHLAIENHSPPIAGLAAQHLPIRPQPQHLPNPQGASAGSLPPLHLHHPGLMAAHPNHLPPTTAGTPTHSAVSPVLSPLRIRVNSPSRINSELLDKSVSSATTPTSTATVRDEECSPIHHHGHHHHHHHHRNTNSSSPITTSVVGVKITASSGQTTVPALHRPFSPSPKLKNVS